jgi:hypothetical protein
MMSPIGDIIRPLALLAGLLSPASAAQAHEAGLPRVAVGDSWQFIVYYTVPPKLPNRTWTIGHVDEERAIGNENGEPLIMTTELNVLDSPRHSESNPRMLSFPLAVGKTWQYESEWLFKQKSSRGTLAVKVAVVAYETIETRAGRFDAFRLEATGELGGASPSNTFFGGQTTTRYWYAPAAKAIVKSIHHNPYQGTTMVELVGYRIREDRP